jgi:serine/threonine-protein kinase
MDIDSLAGQLFDGRYQLAEKVGEGGMSLVYRARDTQNDDHVAVKILLPALINDPTTLARLHREAELGAKLEHPNLCHIIRMGKTTAGRQYVVMPFMQGEMLCDRVWRAGQLPLDIAVRIVRDISSGLQLAHELGVIHRDLKPENVIIAVGADGTERAVLLDFGLAIGRHANPDNPRLTKAGMVVGTPDFMSPEQMRGLPVDQRSDIFSLAFLTYEMLTGASPFRGTTLRDMAIARAKGESIPIRTQRPDLDLPVAVEKVLTKALAAEPGDRYNTAREFGQAFSRAATPGSGPGFLARILGR